VDIITYEEEDLLPGVILDKNAGKFEIYGKSCPVDGIEFYEPIFNWFDQYKNDPLERTNLDFKLTYFNTISAKVILKLMTKMEDLSNLGHEVKIRWYYTEGDEELEEAGEKFANIVNVNFEYIPVCNNESQQIDESEFENLMDELFKL